MIFQPNGGAGDGKGLTIYKGNISNTSIVFETPVKIVFLKNYYSHFPFYIIVAAGESQIIYTATESWPPEQNRIASLSEDGKTLTCRDFCLYYAIG